MKLIFDLGCHKGEDSEFYLKKGFKVVAVDPNPYCCKEVRNRLGMYIQTGQLILEEYAISNSQTPIIDFIVHRNHTDWGTTNPKWNNKYPDETEKIKVITCTLTSLMHKYGMPYYIKSDLEGCDGMVIRQLKGKKLPKYYSAELLTFNNYTDPNANCLDVIHALLEVGYTKFQIVDQGKNHLTKCPNPPLEENYVDYKFDGFTSGLFGKELSDKWVTIDKILPVYINYFYNIKSDGIESLDRNSWFDLHSTY
jgi:FkbM family methyltransferase